MPKKTQPKLSVWLRIHEAGHAVARYLTAQDFGYTTNHSISYIEVAPATPVGRSVDGIMNLTLQATTYGPMLSKEIQEIAVEISPKS